MKLSDIMTRDPVSVEPRTNVRECAILMRQEDVGSIPVCEGKRLVGVITDRDIVLRTIAADKDPAKCAVQDVMTRDVIACSADKSDQDAVRLMQEHGLRRLCIVDANRTLIGIVSIGDLAQGSGASAAGSVIADQMQNSGAQEVGAQGASSDVH